MFPFSALSVTTNLLKHPKLTLVPSPKAAPTVQVSLSNATSAAPVSHSCIPFPSQPIECLRVSREEDTFDSFLAYDAWTVGSPPRQTAAEVWSMDVCRKRAECSTSSCNVQRKGRKKDPHDVFMQDDAPCASSAAGPRKRKIAVRRVKVPAASKAIKRQKKSKGAKRQIADLQFTAILHRSIVAHLRDPAFAPSSVSRSYPTSTHTDEVLLRTQDQLLAKRLWKNLVDQGLATMPLSSRPQAASAFISDADLFGLRPERVDHIFQSEPLHHPSSFATLTSAPYPPTTPITVPGQLVETQTELYMDCESVTPSPSHSAFLATTQPMVGGSHEEVLALPQLVASLILRHRDRSATRPRTGPQINERRPTGRSPLSTLIRIAPTPRTQMNTPCPSSAHL